MRNLREIADKKVELCEGCYAQLFLLGAGKSPTYIVYIGQAKSNCVTRQLSNFALTFTCSLLTSKSAFKFFFREIQYSEKKRLKFAE